MGRGLSGIHFWVSDMERTLTFYRAIGLEIPEPEGDGQFVQVTLPNGVDLGFGSYDVTRRYDPAFKVPSGGKGGLALQFNLDSRPAVNEMYQRLTTAGYAGHLAPMDAPWGSRYAEVSDPDGNVVGFQSPQNWY